MPSCGRFDDGDTICRAETDSSNHIPEVAAGDSPLTDAMKGKLKERAFDRYQTRLDKGVDDKVLMYFILVATISTVSLILVKQHANYLVGCEQQRDGEILAAIIASTHHNEIGGNNVLRTHFMRKKKEMEFGLFKITVPFNPPLYEFS